MQTNASKAIKTNVVGPCFEMSDESACPRDCPLRGTALHAVAKCPLVRVVHTRNPRCTPERIDIGECRAGEPSSMRVRRRHVLVVARVVLQDISID